MSDSSGIDSGAGTTGAGAPGTPPAHAYAAAQPAASNATAQPAPSNATALWAFITGLAGVVLLAVFMTTPAGAWTMWLGGLLGLVGVILGIVALRRRQSKGMAVTGLIAGLLAVLASIAIGLFALLFVGAFLSIAG